MPDLALDRHFAAELLGRPVDLGEAEARSAPLGARGEERLEDARHHLRRHSLPGIAHAEPHVVPCWQMVGPRVVVTDIRSLQGQLPTLGHRIAGVDRKVEDGMLDPGRVGHGGP